MKKSFYKDSEGNYLQVNGNFVYKTLDIKVIEGGTATGVTVTHYSTSEETTLKNELISAGTYTAAQLADAYIINISGTTVGTVILDVSSLGSVGDYIKLMHKKSDNTWETLYTGDIPSSGQITVTLTEFSPIVGAQATRASNVSITTGNPGLSPSYVRYNFNIYDGQDESGTLVATTSAIAQTRDVTVSSGYLYLKTLDPDDNNSPSCSCSDNLSIISTTSQALLVQVSGDGTITYLVSPYCFIEGTKITLADGTYKNVEDITYDDDILVWNMYEGKLDSAKPYWISEAGVCYNYADVLFNDGTKLSLTGPEDKLHRLFSIEKQEFVYANELIGDHVYCQDGSIKRIIGIDRINKEVKFYNFKTEKYLNCFANGILTGHTFNNIYDIKDMQYINLDNSKYTQEEIDNLETSHNVNPVNGYKGNFKIQI